jgi:hypothetical protein
MPVATFRPVGSTNSQNPWGITNASTLHEAIDEVAVSTADSINSAGLNNDTCKIEFDFDSVLSSSDTINSVTVYLYCYARKSVFRVAHDNVQLNVNDVIVVSNNETYALRTAGLTVNKDANPWTANDLINYPEIELMAIVDGLDSNVYVAQMYVEVDYTGGTPPVVEEDDAIFFGND